MPAAVSVWSQRLMTLVAVLAVCGIVVSSVSLQHHFATSKTAYCDIGEAFNCDIVNRSEYSSILGMPVALIGMLGYASIGRAGHCVSRAARDAGDALRRGGVPVWRLLCI